MITHQKYFCKEHQVRLVLGRFNFITLFSFWNKINFILIRRGPKGEPGDDGAKGPDGDASDPVLGKFFK